MSWEAMDHFPCWLCSEGAGRGRASSSRLGYQPLEGAHSGSFLPGIISVPEAWCPAQCPENGSKAGTVPLLASLVAPGGAGCFPAPREIVHRQVSPNICPPIGWGQADSLRQNRDTATVLLQSKLDLNPDPLQIGMF